MNVFRLEALRVVLRVAVPVVLGVDMLHSFYFVGCLIKEKRALEAERYRRQILHDTVSFFEEMSKECTRTDFSFWPPWILRTVQSTPLPDLSSLPRPSYELDDEDEPNTNTSKTSGTRLRPFPNESAPMTGHLLSLQDGSVHVRSSRPENENGQEMESIEPNETIEHSKTLHDQVDEAFQNFYELLVPYPIRHPIRFAKALKAEVEKELRLHMKRSQGYFESKGMWLRRVLHLPYLVIQRRSALRFRFKIIPV